MLVTSIPQYVQGLTNAKLDLTTTNATTLYTAPATADFNASVVNSIIVSNDSGSSDTITLTVTNGSDEFSLFKVGRIIFGPTSHNIKAGRTVPFKHFGTPTPSFQRAGPPVFFCYLIFLNFHN